MDENPFVEGNTLFFKEFLDAWRATRLWTETLLWMKTLFMDENTFMEMLDAVETLLWTKPFYGNVRRCGNPFMDETLLWKC